MREKVLRYMEDKKMLAAGQRVVVGLSGGGDSVCLLVLLARLRQERSIRIRAVHVHHGLRGQEADRDAEFAGQLCRKLNIPFFLKMADVRKEAKVRRISQEEAGRLLRYEVFEEEAEKWEREEEESLDNGLQKAGLPVRIAVAHHGDDSAETILYHLFRGSGLRGLAGIAPVRGRIIRPLLCVSRQEILNFLQTEKIPYVTDSTNLLNDYTRNRIRNQILPAAQKEINANAKEHILKAGEIIAEADQFFTERARQFLEREENVRKNDALKGADCFILPAEKLESLAHIEQGYAVRGIFTKMGWPLKNLKSLHIESVIALAGGRTGAEIDLPGGIKARRSYENLFFVRGEEENGRVSGEQQQKNSLPTLSMETEVWENGAEIPKNIYTKWFDYDKIKDTLSVRYRLPGDYVTLKGGGKKSLKSLFIDEKVPREERDRIPLLAEGSHVLWIIGGRISEYYKITEQTKKILKVQLDGGTNCG